MARRRWRLVVMGGLGVALGVALVAWRRRHQIVDEAVESEPQDHEIEVETTAPPPAEGELATVQGKRVHREAAAAYERLLAAARAEGIAAPLLEIVSGYRSPERQATLWSQALAKHRGKLRARLGREPSEAEVVAEARKWVAPPGRSSHQSGKALDLNLGLPNRSENAEAQRKTAAYRWLQANMGRFGFEPYEREPWHIVYRAD